MAGKIVFLYDNFADQGIFVPGYGSWSLPLTNLQDPDIQRVARSADAQNSSTRFRMDLGRQQGVDGVALGPVNISPGASWRARGYSDASFTTLVWDTGVQTVGGNVIDWSNSANWLEWEDPNFWTGVTSKFDNLPVYLYVVADVTKLAQYWQVEMFDSSNAEGSLSVGRLMIARAYRPSYSYGEGNSFLPDPMTDMLESLGGLRVYWERGMRRKATYPFPSLDESELFGDVLAMALKSGISRQLFAVPDPTDLTSGQRRSFLCTLSAAPKLQQLLVARGTTAFDVEEVV